MLHPLFHSLTGHSEYCWEPNWDCDPDWITVSSEFMVSSLEGIPERIGGFIHNPINNQCADGVKSNTYFLHVRTHKMVPGDSIRSASCRCIWWICRSWEDKTKGRRFKPGRGETGRCRGRRTLSPLGETAARCASDNTGSRLRRHTWMAPPTRPRVSHSDRAWTCSHGYSHKRREPGFLHSLPVFELPGVASAIPAVVIVGTSVTLSA